MLVENRYVAVDGNLDMNCSLKPGSFLSYYTRKATPPIRQWLYGLIYHSRIFRIFRMHVPTQELIKEGMMSGQPQD